MDKVSYVGVKLKETYGMVVVAGRPCSCVRVYSGAGASPLPRASPNLPWWSGPSGVAREFWGSGPSGATRLSFTPTPCLGGGAAIFFCSRWWWLKNKQQTQDHIVGSKSPSLVVHIIHVLNVNISVALFTGNQCFTPSPPLQTISHRGGSHDCCASFWRRVLVSVRKPPPHNKH